MSPAIPRLGLKQNIAIMRYVCYHFKNRLDTFAPPESNLPSVCEYFLNKKVNTQFAV